MRRAIGSLGTVRGRGPNRNPSPTAKKDSMETIQKNTLSQTGTQTAERGGKYLTFSLANQEYGVGILEIREIIGMMPITAIPQAPAFVRGQFIWGSDWTDIE